MGVIDGVYEELMEVMKQGLVEVSAKKVRRGQPWFTREIVKLRKEFHRAERDWLVCDDQGRRKQKRREYVEKRRMYKKTVSRAQREFNEKRYDELEKAFRKPQKWWRIVQRVGVRHRKGQKADTTKVYDASGGIKGEEAVGLWKRYFERVLNVDEVGEDSEELRGAVAVDPGNMVVEDIMREVVQALNGLRQRSAPGRDGVTVEMMCCEVLVDIWWTLFAWCWKTRMTPSEYRSVIVPILKKRSNGVCRTEDFRGISLVSVAYKTMCSMPLNEGK